LPAEEGVPLIAPVEEFNDKPGGKDPEETLYVGDGTAVALTESENAVPDVIEEEIEVSDHDGAVPTVCEKDFSMKPIGFDARTFQV